MWRDIHPTWQSAFSMGWEAFLNGSIPIGAVITDESGNIISTGRNRNYEKSCKNPKIAHAETEALRHLDAAVYTNPHGYTLYACMEPCPMCMGAFVMANLRTLRVAARDAWCGAVHYLADDPYMRSKNVTAVFEGGDLETVQLTMQAYHELKMRGGASSLVLDRFAQDNPRVVAAAKKLYETRYLDKCAEKGVPFEIIFNHMIAVANIVNY